jgi:hypothetical protein
MPSRSCRNRPGRSFCGCLLTPSGIASTCCRRWNSTTFFTRICVRPRCCTMWASWPLRMPEFGSGSGCGDRWCCWIPWQLPALLVWPPAAGCSALTCWLIAHHQEGVAPTADAARAGGRDMLLSALYWADNRN